MKNKPSKKKIIITSIVSVFAISLGVGVGVFFGQEFLGTRTNYDAFDPLNYEDDIDALYKEYSNSNGDYSSFEPYELVSIAYHKFELEENSYSVTDGNIAASIVNQTLRSVSIKNNDLYFNESISQSGIVSVAKRFYQEAGSVATYNGKDIKDGVMASWNEEDKTISNLEDYEDEWGKTLKRSSIYIISSKTVLNSEVSKEENNYVISLSLNPTTSVLRYVKQMEKMSDLSRKPEFTSVEMKITLDEDLNLVKREIDEVYTVYMMGAHTSNAHLIDFYYPNVKIDIPSLNTNFNYEGENV